MSRAGLIGAYYGALLGCDADPGGMPLHWVALVKDGKALLNMARQLADLRTD